MQKGQVLLTIVFSLTFALFSLYLLLSPIKDKLLRIKDMENVYQAVANAEKGLEAVALSAFKQENLSLSEELNYSTTTNCGGLISNNPNNPGECYEIFYQPITSDLWQPSDNFSSVSYIFLIPQNGDFDVKTKIKSDGIIGRTIRGLILGSER